MNYINDCKFCGGSHVKNRFPAYGKSCLKCNRDNHFARVCKYEKIKIIDDEISNSDEDVQIINNKKFEMCETINNTSLSSVKNKYFITIRFKRGNVKF